jgi:anthranilate synthase component II
MIVVIDNYDSFTWNLVDLLRRNKQLVVVYRNDEVTAAKVLGVHPKGILLSPGPGRPADSGISPELLRLAAGQIPILGICLGHQLIGEHFGMTLSHGDAPVHGKTSSVRHGGQGLFKGVPTPFEAMRYHSLVLDRDPLPESIMITAWTESGEVMAIQHRVMPIVGVQFHPESILTEGGGMIVGNWVSGLI